ncbi:MAG: histidine phosphatase family protein [Neisseria sp.]|nr:histidine phosphatase family protein [Neisseria sp.]
MKTLELYLVRHGKTVFNTTGRLQGWSDSPLTPEGCQVAENLGRGLEQQHITFDAAFSSTSPRAVDTARLILNHSGQADLPLASLPDLREYCFGGFEGELTPIVHEKIIAHRGLPDTESWLAAYRHGKHNLIIESVHALDPLGLAETEAQFTARLQQGLNELITRAPHNGRVLLVSHGIAITAILKMIDAQSTLYQSVPNASVSRLHYQNGMWAIQSIGDTSFSLL